RRTYRRIGETNAQQSRKRWRNVGNVGSAQGLALLNSFSVKQQRHMRVVIVSRMVVGSGAIPRRILKYFRSVNKYHIARTFLVMSQMKLVFQVAAGFFQMVDVRSKVYFVYKIILQQGFCRNLFYIV